MIPGIVSKGPLEAWGGCDRLTAISSYNGQESQGEQRRERQFGSKRAPQAPEASLGANR